MARRSRSGEVRLPSSHSRTTQTQSQSLIADDFRRVGRSDLDSDQEDEDDYVESNVSKYSDHLFKFGEFEQVRCRSFEASS